MEVWKTIKDYEEHEVSNLGRVKNLNYHRTKKEGILRPVSNGRGYLTVILYKNGKSKKFLVHRLVAEAFLPNPDNLPEVNHKDEDKTNNRVENLEWCDRKYNINYGKRNDKVSKSNTNGNRSKPVLQFTLDGTFVREWPSTNECDRNGFSQGHVAACCRGERKKHKGFIWKFKTEKEVV